jgi:hypothetical protein
MPPLGGDWVVPPKHRLGLPLYRGLKVSAIATEEAMSTQDKEQTRAAWDKIAAGYDEFVTPTYFGLGAGKPWPKPEYRLGRQGPCITTETEASSIDACHPDLP